MSLRNSILIGRSKGLYKGQWYGLCLSMGMAVQQAGVDMPGLGTGVYSLRFASHFLKVPVQRIRRWAEGYTRKDAAGRRVAIPPILQREEYYQGIVTYSDLVEMFWIRAYDRANVNMHNTKLASQRLSKILSTPYPFAKKDMWARGRELITESLLGLEEASKGQLVFEFASEDMEKIKPEESWWPMGLDGGVVMNPRIAFGAPIVDGTGIRTDVIYASFQSEPHSEKLVAAWYDVPVSAVRKAIAFEEWLEKAA